VKAISKKNQKVFIRISLICYMKIEVNITKKKFFVILIAIFVLAAGFAVYAYNVGSNYASPSNTAAAGYNAATEAAKFGHTSDELNVKIRGVTETVTLQDAINKGFLSNESKEKTYGLDTYWLSYTAAGVGDCQDICCKSGELIIDYADPPDGAQVRSGGRWQKCINMREGDNCGGSDNNRAGIRCLKVIVL
jgi:hypothetical protein